MARGSSGRRRRGFSSDAESVCMADEVERGGDRETSLPTNFFAVIFLVVSSSTIESREGPSPTSPSFPLLPETFFFFSVPSSASPPEKGVRNIFLQMKTQTILGKKKESFLLLGQTKIYLLSRLELCSFRKRREKSAHRRHTSGGSSGIHRSGSLSSSSPFAQRSQSS